MVRSILHVDQNCFYASVEMQRHPELRNRPLAVCGSQEDRHGIVLTANYLAKPRGVKTGMRRGGITTIGELAKAPLEFLLHRLGKMGIILHTFANGRDISPVQTTEHIPTIKSVGNSATTPRDLINNDDVRLMLLLLSESVCARMRDLASRCTVVEVYVRDTELQSFIRQHKIASPSCSSAELADTAYALFLANYHWEKPVHSIGIRGSGLVEAYECVQMSLYQDDQRRQKWERIDATVDDVRRRYGYMSLQRALIYTDPLLGRINPKDDHTVHPVGFFA